MISETSKILLQELEKCQRDEELQQFLCNYEKKQRNWQEYIREILFDLELSYEKFGKRCGFSKNTIKSWCENGVFPRSREHFIRLGFGARMTEEELNALLQNYGGYGALYAKDVYDAICIYVLQQREKNPEEDIYGYHVLEEYRKLYQDQLEYRKFDSDYRCRESTDYMHETLLSLKDEKQFQDFMESHLDIFCATHSKLIDFMDTYIRMRGREHEEGDSPRSLHQLTKRFRKPQGFEVAYSKLKRHGILPERRMLIDFGVGMNMTLVELNHLLELAQMRPLDVRSRYESIMIYLFHKHERNHPTLSLDNAYNLKKVTDDPEMLKSCERVIEEFYRMDEEGVLGEEGEDDRGLRTIYEEYEDIYEES